LDKQAFGKLCGELEPIFYQKARSNPNEASSFLAKLEFCLVIYTEESELALALLSGRMKKITGRSFIENRRNFEDSGG
jgi:hypothetical protein